MRTQRQSHFLGQSLTKIRAYTILYDMKKAKVLSFVKYRYCTWIECNNNEKIFDLKDDIITFSN